MVRHKWPYLENWPILLLISALAVCNVCVCVDQKVTHRIKKFTKCATKYTAMNWTQPNWTDVTNCLIERHFVFMALFTFIMVFIFVLQRQARANVRNADGGGRARARFGCQVLGSLSIDDADVYRSKLRHTDKHPMHCDLAITLAMVRPVRVSLFCFVGCRCWRRQSVLFCWVLFYSPTDWWWWRACEHTYACVVWCR